MTLVSLGTLTFGVIAAFSTYVTATNEPLHKPQVQGKLMLDDAQVMVAAGRPGRSRVRDDDSRHTRAGRGHCAAHRIGRNQHVRCSWKFDHALT
jgi:hypothetical protein